MSKWKASAYRPACDAILYGVFCDNSPRFNRFRVVSSPGSSSCKLERLRFVILRSDEAFDGGGDEVMVVESIFPCSTFSSSTISLSICARNWACTLRNVLSCLMSVLLPLSWIVCSCCNCVSIRSCNIFNL